MANVDKNFNFPGNSEIATQRLTKSNYMKVWEKVLGDVSSLKNLDKYIWDFQFSLLSLNLVPLSFH